MITLIVIQIMLNMINIINWGGDACAYDGQDIVYHIHHHTIYYI